jgi:hypothetical protein
VIERVALAAVCLGLGACDLVWGLTGEPPKCDLGTDAFVGAGMVSLQMPVEDFSVSVDPKRTIASRLGVTFEVEVGEPVSIDLGQAFVQVSFGLAPEGDFLFFSNQVEPPDLRIAERASDGTWAVSRAAPPAGVHAGSPSALEFGPRRVLVNVGQEGVLDDGQPVRDIQEYVEDGDRWRAVGPRQALGGTFAPNLTPNGMTAVFVEKDADGSDVVAIATRDHVSDEFSDRTVIFRDEPGSTIRSAQLHGTDILDKECATLVVDVEDDLRQYDR